MDRAEAALQESKWPGHANWHLILIFVHPDQNLRLVVEMRDDRFARGALRKMLQKCRSDIHVPEAAARLRLWFSYAIHDAVGPGVLTFSGRTHFLLRYAFPDPCARITSYCSKWKYLLPPPK
jgi:hypothetical protein